MNASARVSAGTLAAARPRMRGLPVLTATLDESRSLIGVACGYIVIIGLLVGLLLPAFKTLNLQVYLTGGVAALIGGAPIGLLAAAIIVATALLTAFGCTLFFPNATLQWRWFMLANLDVAAILFLVVGMGMLVSSIRSAGRAGGGAAVLVVVFWYLCQTFGTAGDRLSFLKYLGPYYYAPSSQVITTEQWSDPWKLLVPVAAGLLLGVSGLVYFQRRDITT